MLKNGDWFSCPKPTVAQTITYVSVFGIGRALAASAALAQPPPAARVIDILTGQGIPRVNVHLLIRDGVETVSGPNGEFTPAPRGTAARTLTKVG